MERFSPFLPEIGLSFKNQTRFTDQDRNHSNSISLDINQNIFAGFRDELSLDIAKVKEEKFKSTSQKTRAEIYAKLLSEASQFVYSSSLTKLNEDIEDRRRRNLSLVRLRFEVGSENKGSVLLSEASLKQASFDLAQSKSLLAESIANLQVTTGFTDLSTFDGKLPLRKPSESDKDLADVSGNPTVKELDMEKKIAQLSTRLEKSAYSPRVDLRGSRVLNSSEETERSQKGLVELSVTVPLFSGFGTVHATKRALEEEKAASLSRDEKAQSLRNDVDKLLSDWKSAYDALDVAENFDKAMVLRTEIARKKYSNGLLSFEEWERMEQELISRQKALLTARKALGETQAAYQQVTGQGEE
jgi:outer membrane protein TolC